MKSARRSAAPMKHGVAALILAGVMWVAASAQQKGTSPAPLVFNDVTVVDVEQGKLLPAQRVIVVGNRIQAVGEMRAVKLPSGAQVVDAHGKYLIPGLWDLHTHPRLYTDFFYPLFVANGVTGLRDAGSDVPLDTLQLWRQQILAGTLAGPRPLMAAQSEIGRLTVQPKAMATGKTTAQAGLQRLDSLYGGDSLLAEAYIYVPKRNVGTQRSPLLVVLHGSGKIGRQPLEDLRPFADLTGIILLAMTSFSDDQGWGDTHSATNVDLPRLDASLRTVLSHFAIDPSKIALYGESAGAGAALDWGYVNGDIFSLVIVDSGFGPFGEDHEFDAFKAHGTPKFYIAMNTEEFGEAKGIESLLQRIGRSVMSVKDDYEHGVNPGRASGEFAWLTKNWS